jgi:phosphoribosylpyrophosphate synthetase
VRYGDSRRITVKEGEAKGKHVVLVDDMIQSGGTLLETGKALLALGAASVSAFCTHGVFPNQAHTKFLDKTFRKVWITDSCPDKAAEIDGTGPFEVLSLAPLIAQIVDLSTTQSADTTSQRRLGLSRL